MPMEDLLNAEHTELRMMEDERLIGLSPVSTNPLRQVINVYRFYSNDNLFNCIWCASRVEHHPNTICEYLIVVSGVVSIFVFTNVAFWPSVVATASPKMSKRFRMMFIYAYYYLFTVSQ